MIGRSINLLPQLPRTQLHGHFTAAAYKLARIIKHRVPYDAFAFATEKRPRHLRREKYLQKQAASPGFQLAPLQSNG